MIHGMHNNKINRETRNKRNKHRSLVIWFTGLSGSGKSTIANLVEKELYNRNIQTCHLDGDNIRKGINKELDFSETGRYENIRIAGEIARLFVDAGIVVIASFITPLEKDREMLKTILGKENIIEIFVNTSLEECERNDVKGLYKKARQGLIKDFTGISAPYENPKNPNIEINPENASVESSVKKIIDAVLPRLKL